METFFKWYQFWLPQSGLILGACALTILIAVTFSARAHEAPPGGINTYELQICLLKVSSASKLLKAGQGSAAMWQLEKAGKLCAPLLKAVLEDPRYGVRGPATIRQSRSQRM